MKKLLAAVICSLGFLQLFGADVIGQWHAQLRKASNREQQVRAWNELAWAYQASSHDSALFYARKALVYAKKNSKDSILGDSYNRMGTYFFSHGMYDSACINHFRSYEARKKASDITLRGNAAFNTGASYLRWGKHSNAIDFLNDALKIYHQVADSHRIVKTRIQMAVVYTENGQFTKAKTQIAKIEENPSTKRKLQLRTAHLMAKARFYERMSKHRMQVNFASKAYILYKNEEDSSTKQDLVRSLNFMGNGHKGLKDMDSALYYYSRGYILAKQECNSSLKQQLLGNLGQLWSILGDQDSSSHYFNLAQRIRAPSTNGLLQKQLADHFFEKSQFDSAVVAYENSLEHPSKSKPIRMEILFNIHHAYKRLGNYEEATKALFQYEQLRDTMALAEEELEKLENQLEKEKAKRRIEQEQLKNERLRNQNLILGIITSGLLIIILLGIMAYQKEKDRKNLAKKDKEVLEEKVDSILKNQELQSIVNVLEIQEKERMRIAQDLHDRLGGMLATVRLLFDDVQISLGKLQSQYQTSYRKALSILDTASNEVRKVAHDLVSGSLKNFGLKVALKELADTIRQPNSMDFEFISHGFDERLPKNHEAHLYRIVQEMISNTLKHSGANKIALQLLRDKGRLNLIYEDNGNGFLPENVKAGMGLKSIESRVQKLDGTMNIDSGKGAGTTYNITIPYKTIDHDTAYHSG